MNIRFAIPVGLLSIVLLTNANAQHANPDQLKNEGNLLYRDGKIDEAILKWQEAIIADSTYSFAYNNIGIALYDRKQYSEAVEYLKRAVVFDTTYAKAFNSLGNTYLALGEYENARTAYQSAIKYEPQSAENITNLGNVYLALGEYDQAMETYDRALAINANHAPALNNRGLILQRRGKMDDAIESFRKAIKADSQFPDAYANLGALYLQREDPDGIYLKTAFDYLSRAEKIDGENQVIKFNISLCYLRQENATKARQALLELQKKNPNDPYVQYALGHTYAQANLYEQALKSFTQAFTLDPDYTEARIAIDAVSGFVKK
jgi:tetratricopeptide (TPR) repeat protein